ncbi:hypothetical protein C5167_007170 [Papaver somniferum]|uniref:Uncharacterized protein n=1 Tax=Papaver somniferum TaxID=3469 RepID=A0A4Y7JGI2_PAPSO|nr:hypothetical protein C5167_007170 [Papaver somniferum]
MDRIGPTFMTVKAQGVEVGKAIRKLVDEDDGESLLHAAATGGRLNVCKYLVETLKVDVDFKDGDGYVPLHHAIFKGHLDIVRYLLEKGAKADASSDGNYTPLHIAAKTVCCWPWSSRIRDAVKVLLDHGANPNAVISPGMLSPLMSAILFESWEYMELLLQAGANPSAESYGNTPLILAAKEEYVGVIMRLLEAGADPNYKMSVGLTALEIAAMRCNYQIFEILFPVTSRIPTYPDWSIGGLMRHVHSDAYKMQIIKNLNKSYALLIFSEAGNRVLRRGTFQAAEYGSISSLTELLANGCGLLYSRSGSGSGWACVVSMRESLLQREIYKKEKFHQAKSKGRDAFQEEQYLTAVNWFNEALDICPKDPAVLSNMSACYARLGDGFNALELGVALNILKRYGDAANAFNKGLTLDPRNKEFKDAYMKAMEDRLNSIK